MKGKITIITACILLLTLLSNDNLAITPVTSKPVTDDDNILYEAKNDVLVFELDISSPKIVFAAQFTVTESWRQVTVLQLPLVIDATGKVDAITVIYELEGFNGTANYQRSQSFKLQHELEDLVVFSAVIDARDELAGFFSNHSFLYDLQLTLTFHPSPLLSRWSCNLTVNPPALQTFDPVVTAELPGTDSNATGEAVLQCFPASGTYTMSSATGFRFETIFFIDCRNMPSGEQVQVTVKVDSSSSHSSIARISVTDLNSNKVLVNALGEKETYTFTIGGDSSSTLQVFKLSVDLSGTVIPETFVLKPLVTANRKSGIIIGLPGEELLFTPIPTSLHLPLMVLSVSPLGIAGYVLKKGKDREKIEKEIF